MFKNFFLTLFFFFEKIFESCLFLCFRHIGVLISLVPFTIRSCFGVLIPFPSRLHQPLPIFCRFPCPCVLLAFSLSLRPFSFFGARLCHMFPLSKGVAHCCCQLAIICRVPTVHTGNRIHCIVPFLVFFPFLLSVPSNHLSSPDVVLHRRLHRLLHFPSSPGPCLLAPSDSSLSNCMLFASLTDMSLTRLYPPAPTVVQSAWGVCHTTSAISGRCHISCLCAPRTSAPVLQASGSRCSRLVLSFVGQSLGTSSHLLSLF